MANTSLGTPSDTRIIIQFRSITQKIDIMIKLKLSILVWAIGLSMTAFSQTTSSLRAKVLTLNDYPDALRLWELYNDSASVEQKSVIEGNWEFIFLFDRHVYAPPRVIAISYIYKIEMFIIACMSCTQV